MEKKRDSEKFKNNKRDTLVCNKTNKYNKKFKKFYACEEKWNILQTVQTMSIERVCEKFNVELAVLKRWIENSVIIREELMKKTRGGLSLSSNCDSESSSNNSESDMSGALMPQEDKEEILKNFKILSKQQFNQKYKINKYLLHILIVQRQKVKETSEKGGDKNTHNELIDSNTKNYLNCQQPNKGYTPREWTRMMIEINKARKLVECLHNWYFQMQQKGIFVAEFMLKEKAKRIAKALNYSKFRANNIWLDLWYEIHNINVRTINKSAEHFDRAFFYDNTDFAKCSSKKHIQENWANRLEEIDNVGEDLFFWYDDHIKSGKFVSDEELYARAEEVSIALNDRPFYPDIVWLYEWKKQYNIPCAETEWKLFKSDRMCIKKNKNVKKRRRCLKKKKLTGDKFSEKQRSSSTSSSDLNISNKIHQKKLWRPF